ncbi:MAG TPA: isoprenylcysteine carboxylmethyltransferase family protein [Bordetella sp.]|nr:isoprenylcysteine carboxylmethyltransferase family protein [Bordetella sp.]
MSLIWGKTAAANRGVGGRLERVQVARRRAFWVLGVLIGSGALFFQSTWMIGGSVHHNIQVAGMLMIFGAILGRSWCSLYMGGNKTRELVHLGPYSISRNPLYGFSLMGVFGIGAQSGSALLGIILCALALAVFSLVIREEEALLTTAFGDSFLEYCRNTPRFGPRLANWRNSTKMTVSLQAWHKTVREALPFLLAFPAFASIEFLQAHAILPVLLRLP